MKKRLLALILAVLLLGSIGAVSVFADEEPVEMPAAEEILPEEIEESVEEIPEEPEENEPAAEVPAAAEEESEPVIIDTDLVLEEDFTVEAGQMFIFTGNVTVPEGLSFINRGTVSFEETVEVYGALINEGIMSVEESAVLTLCSEADEAGAILSAAELVNLGEFSVYGSVEMQDGVVFADTNNPLVCLENGSVLGTAHFTVNGLPGEEVNEISAEEFKALCAENAFEEGKEYVLSESVSISAAEKVCLTNGRVSVPAGIDFEVNGALIITGGSLNFAPGAALFNNLFISVENTGSLVLEKGAEYIPSDTSAVVWNQGNKETSCIVSGIDRCWIDCTVTASSIREFRQSLIAEDYHTLTVFIENPDFVTAVDAIPEGIAVCLK